MASPLPLLILVSLDGFRHDFISQGRTPNLYKLRSEGSYFAKGSGSQFPTSTMPNHVAILTGLQEASNGIVGNTFFDPILGDTYDYWNFTGNQSRWLDSAKERWYSGRPIWLANQMASPEHRSGTIKFPAADIVIGGRKATERIRWTDYNQLEGWKKDFDTLLSWFTRQNDPINLGLMYISQPDHLQHQHGVQSQEVAHVLHEIDQFVGYMESELKSAELWDRLNLIITADHGHIDAVYPDGLIDIGAYPALSKAYRYSAEVSWHRPVSMTEKESRIVFNQLRANLSRDGHADHVHLFFKPDLIQEFKTQTKTEHDYLRGYINSPRVGDIIIIAACNTTLCYRISTNISADRANAGRHGQHMTDPSNPSMRGALILHGPAFKDAFVDDSSQIQNIDLYPLMCNVLKLGLACGPHNGSLTHIERVLKSSYPSGFLSSLSLFGRSLVVLFAIVLPLAALLLYCLTRGCPPSTGSESDPAAKGYAKLRQDPGDQANGVSNGARSLVSLGDVDEMSEEEL